MKNQQYDQNFSQMENFSTQKQIYDAYQQIEDEVRQKFKELTTDTLQEIRKNIKKHQNRISQEENFNLIAQQRGKIITEMQDHISKCYHPQCKQIKQVTLLYGFSKGLQMKDTVSYIANQYISGLNYKNSQCFVAQKLNQKMLETHKIFKAL